MTFETTLCEWNTTRDSFEDGADPNGTTCVLSENPHLSASSVKELVEKACSRYGLSCPDPSNWHVDEDTSSISTNFLVDEDNSEVDQDGPLYAQFKDGKRDLWILDFWISVRYVDERNPTKEEFAPFASL